MILSFSNKNHTNKSLKRKTNNMKRKILILIKILDEITPVNLKKKS